MALRIIEVGQNEDGDHVVLLAGDAASVKDSREVHATWMEGRNAEPCHG